jgi:DNA replication and repair protein RecF
VRLLALHVQDFRNLLQVSLAPSPHATIAVGQNGQGKTNLLEAL